METRLLPADQPQTLTEALACLRAGGLAAFPTDTVYGLGALAFMPQAIEGLYSAKGRSAAKAIAILVGSPGALALVASVMGPLTSRLAEHFWPGPLTLVVPRHPGLPGNLSPDPTIGVRMPAHPLALELLNQSGPLAVTSANLSGQANTVTARQVFDQLDGRIPLIIDGGETPGGLPSTVVDCTGDQPRILRQGPVSLEQILSATR